MASCIKRNSAHSILLTDDSLTGLFHVEIVPPLEAGNFDQSFRTHKQARGYAGGLRLSLNFALVDHTGPEQHGAG